MEEIKIPITEDVTSSSYGNPPENKEDYKAYDIYRKLDGKEKKAMQESIEKYSVKFSAGLDERVLPAMPKTRNATLQGKRNFLKIIAERQARLQAQIDWLHREQEKYRKLRDEA
jgi:nitrogenase molybdenum-iron protein alpha/beta subunit